MDASWAQGGAYPERLDRMVACLFDMFEAKARVLSILSMTTDLGLPEGALPADRIRRAIAGFLSEGTGAGAYADQPADVLAALVHGTVDGTMRHYLVGRMGKADAVLATRDYLRRAVVVT